MNWLEELTDDDICLIMEEDYEYQMQEELDQELIDAWAGEENETN